MSLSNWFRDYVYLPLGGNRVSPARTYLNLVTVFFLCGLWHGASWTFVVWGLFHGAFLVVERRFPFAARGSASVVVLRHIYTLLVVIVGWVFFRADTLPAAVAFLRAMAGFGVAAPTAFSVSWYLTPELWLGLIAGALGSMPLVPALERWMNSASPATPATGGSRRLSRSRTSSPTLRWTMDAAAVAALSLILVASILQVAARSYSPFIYFRF
jgi:alginate O-acetyltransferase complex protein AlgI